MISSCGFLFHLVVFCRPLCGLSVFSTTRLKTVQNLTIISAIGKKILNSASDLKIERANL